MSVAGPESHATPPAGVGLSATSWGLALLLAVPAVGLLALHTSSHVHGRLPPIDLRCAAPGIRMRGLD